VSWPDVLYTKSLLYNIFVLSLSRYNFSQSIRCDVKATSGTKQMGFFLETKKEMMKEKRGEKERRETVGGLKKYPSLLLCLFFFEVT
jgi:hypothetical protein